MYEPVIKWSGSKRSIESVESIQILKPKDINVTVDALHHYKEKRGKSVTNIPCNKNELIISGYTEDNRFFEIKIVGNYDLEIIH